MLIIWSEVHKNKVIYKISAQYVIAYGTNVQKTVYFKYFDFEKGNNSYKN